METLGVPGKNQTAHIRQSYISESGLKFKVAMNLIPPMIPPKQRRAEINTEAHKKSVYLKEKFDGKEGVHAFASFKTFLRCAYLP